MRLPIYLFVIATSFMFVVSCASTKKDSEPVTEYETLEVAPASTDSK